MISEQLQSDAARLLRSAGVQGSSFRWTPVSGGANNKVFRIDLSEGSFLLKVYFRHPGDLRDRLKTEFSFIRFAWDNGIRSVPQPFAFDAENQIGLYEFIDGRRIDSTEITSERVAQAACFYQELNRYRNLPEALMLPAASEACFSVTDHLGCVERRLSMLQNIEISSSLRQEASSFIRKELTETWERTREFVLSSAREMDLPVETEIASDERRLSPSDFGFHNALLQQDGRIRFIDFEYAGWDDPGKLAADFFCLQGVRVPNCYYDLFVEAIVHDDPSPVRQRERIRFLCAIHRVKWCFILLNDFLPVGSDRRRFSNDAAVRVERERIQLRKAREAENETRQILPKAISISDVGR